MEGFPKHQSYRDSEVEWLGAIPSHWSVKRNISLFDERKEVNHPEMDLLSVTIDRGVIPQSEITTKKDSSNEDKSKYKVVHSGDLAYNKMRMWQGAIGTSEYDGIVSPAYIILNTRDKAYSKYFHFLYRTELFIKEANRHSYGLCDDMNSLRYEDFKTIYSPFPPREEVLRIVTFLDQKTTEIDEAINKKQRLIELLQEQKAILINQAVTKGLNPNVPMRDSGVEWVGEIPAHWKVLPLTKYVRSIVDYRGKTPTKVEFGTFLVTAKNIKNGEIDYEASKEYVAAHQYERIMSRGKPIRGDLLFTTEAPLGDVALVNREDIALAQRIIKFRLDEELLLPKFTKYSIMSSYFQRHLSSEATGSTAQGIKASKLHKLRVVTPPIGEQQLIIREIKDRSVEIDACVESTNSEISLLRELRGIFVSQAVTGKIKV